MKPVLELAQVSKHYGEFCALADVSLKLQEGEIMGLLGHNGAGKTTTMKLVLGVITASHGQVRLFGASPIGPQADILRRRMGYLPENVSFYNQLSGREVLAYFGRLKQVSAVAQADRQPASVRSLLGCPGHPRTSFWHSRRARLPSHRL